MHDFYHLELLFLIKKFLNDTNYNWNNKQDLNFKPNLQFVLKDTGKEQFLLLFSKSTKQIGIIDLEGQKTLSINSKFYKYLISKFK